MKYLSRMDLEKISRMVFQRYKDLPEVKNQTIYRIEPTLLAKKLLGLSTEFTYITSDNSILGLTTYINQEIELFNGELKKVYELDGKTILVERSLLEDEKQTGRLNFTVAHEVSHHILNLVFPTNYDKKIIHYYRPNNYSKGNVKSWEEWQADTLAAYILMPEEIIKRGIELFDVPKIICKTRLQWRNDSYQRFMWLAEFMGVSKKALSIRLESMGYIFKSGLYSSIDIDYE